MIVFKRKKQAQASKRHIITHVNPKSPISEQYRTIRTNIRFSSIDNNIQTILVTSAETEAGKSITSANLAVVYAQQGMKTLLIDADLRKPTIHFTFNLNNLYGLSNVLAADRQFEQAVVSTDIPNLHVLTCGPIPPNPSELLGSTRMQEMLEQAKKLYDFIIFDTPPALVVTDATILANIVDGSIIVIRSGKTKTENAEKAVALMTDTKSKMLGAILNDAPKSKSIYHYYY